MVLMRMVMMIEMILLESYRIDQLLVEIILDQLNVWNENVLEMKLI